MHVLSNKHIDIEWIAIFGGNVLIMKTIVNVGPIAHLSEFDCMASLWSRLFTIVGI